MTGRFLVFGDRRCLYYALAQQNDKKDVETLLSPPYNYRAVKKRHQMTHGCLAQLGEHLFDVQEVTGSIPVAPTMLSNIRGIPAVFFCLLW